MGSRVREKPKRLFEFFAEVAKPDNESGTEAFILQSYPPDFDEEDVINNVTKFAFPCETDGSAVDHFTFVLTDVESMYRFGFCRHATGAQTCLCVVSFLPWFEVFYNFLNHLAEILNRSEKNVIDPLLRAAYVQEISEPSIPVTVVAQQEMFSFKTPDANRLPSIPNSRNLTEYYNAIDCNNMMQIFAGMLNERRILITSKKLSRLTACVHGSEALLYPMHWQHLFIPVLPSHLIDYCSAPMPYLIGVHSTIMEKIRRSELGDAIIVDADKNTVDSEHEDLEDIPAEVVSHLKKAMRSLQSDRIKTTVPLTGDAISKAFLQALIKLIGGYRDALRFRTGEPITFEPEAFVRTRPIHMQAFLEKMLHLQIFQQFINERLDMLNLGRGFSDIFETEATLQGDKLNAQSRYKDWLTSMKKQGKKFQRGSKDAWSDIKKKAGPMMDSAVKSLSSTGQKAYKGIKSKIGNLNKEEVGGVRPYNSVKTPPFSKPIDRHSRPSTIMGPELKTSRPLRPPPPRSTSSSSDIGRPTQDKLVRPRQTSRNYRLLSTEKSVDDTDPRLEYSRISINLLEDPDIQNAMRKSASMEMVVPGHGVSEDSLSSADQSSCTDRSSELDIAGVSLIEEAEGEDYSQSVRTVTNQTYMAPPVNKESPWKSPDMPIPAPRTKRRLGSGGKGPKTLPPRVSEKPTPPPVPEKPLIHLESPEKPLSPSSTNFDPLCDNQSQASTQSNMSGVCTLEQSPVVSLPGPTRQPSLTRSPAFRTGSGGSPRFTSPKSPQSQPACTNDSTDLHIFDPLVADSSSPQHNSENRSAGSTHDPHGDLMGSWNFADIAGTPNKTPPKPPPKTYRNSQVSNQRAISYAGESNIGQLGRSARVGNSISPTGNIVTGGGTGVSNSHLYTAQGGNRTPVYFPSGQPSGSSHLSSVLQPQNTETNNTQASDPFASLVDLSPAKQAASPPPRASWERFDQ